MSEIKRREDESLLGFYKRITENRKELGLSYEEWGELIIGENRYSSDNCRKALYLVKPMLESLEEEQINKITDNDIIKEIEDKKEELIKERMKLQTTKIEYNRNLRKDSRFEMFYENINDARDRLPMPVFEELICEEQEGEYVLALADIHYGAFFESINNSYSREEVQRRFGKLIAKLKVLIHKNEINKLNIIELGDTIQGMLRLSDVKLNDIPVVDSVVEVSRLIATFLNELSRYTKITYRQVMASNHSQNRYLGTKANEMPNEDMERVIGNYIKDLVANNPRVEVVLSERDYDSFELSKQKILTLHGHQIKNINNAIRDYSMLHRTFYDICFVAHFHGGKQMSVAEGNGNTEIVVCPSFIGSDPYSDSLKIGSKGMCRLFKIEENQGITEQYTIILN